MIDENPKRVLTPDMMIKINIIQKCMDLATTFIISYKNILIHTK